VTLTDRRQRMAWVFLAPMLAALALVALWPLLRTIWLGFTDATLASTESPHWVGLENYLFWADGYWDGVLADPDWWQAVRNTLRFAAVSVALETVLGLAVALVLHQSFPGRGFVRAAVLIPWAIPTIVSAQMWGWMLHDQFGVINDLLLRAGLIAAPVAWTADPATAWWTIVVVDVWKTTPFMALLILAALQMLPKDCYEAARLDGVSSLRMFWFITLPLIWPAVMVAIIFRLLDALRVFDLVYVLTGNSRDVATLSVYTRQQLVDFQDTGWGSASSTLLFLVIALVMVVVVSAGRVRLAGHARETR
jgi:trehalose/maltose transport system permease protein